MTADDKFNKGLKAIIDRFPGLEFQLVPANNPVYALYHGIRNDVSWMTISYELFGKKPYMHVRVHGLDPVEDIKNIYINIGLEPEVRFKNDKTIDIDAPLG